MGFTTSVNESVLEVEMKPITYKIIEKLHKDFVVTSSDGKLILGDTGAKLQQKTHQIFSGTIKFEDGSTRVIDDSKGQFILNTFADYKIGIFYKFVAELEMLKTVLKDKLTTDLDEFNSSDKWIALQYQSGKEGISLKNAEYLVALNIDFSSSTYWQFRDRMTTLERKENTLFWIFSKKGIEEKIYKTVLKKKDFTLSIFKKEYNVRKQDTEQNYKEIRERRLLSAQNYKAK